MKWKLMDRKKELFKKKKKERKKGRKR